MDLAVMCFFVHLAFIVTLAGVMYQEGYSAWKCWATGVLCPIWVIAFLLGLIWWVFREAFKTALSLKEPA